MWSILLPWFWSKIHGAKLKPYVQPLTIRKSHGKFNNGPLRTGLSNTGWNYPKFGSIVFLKTFFFFFFFLFPFWDLFLVGNILLCDQSKAIYVWLISVHAFIVYHFEDFALLCIWLFFRLNVKVDVKLAPRSNHHSEMRFL